MGASVLNETLNCNSQWQVTQTGRECRKERRIFNLLLAAGGESILAWVQHEHHHHHTQFALSKYRRIKYFFTALLYAIGRLGGAGKRRKANFSNRIGNGDCSCRPQRAAAIDLLITRRVYIWSSVRPNPQWMHTTACSSLSRYYSHTDTTTGVGEKNMIKQTSSSIDTTARLLLFPISNIDFESLSLPACLPHVIGFSRADGRWPVFLLLKKKRREKLLELLDSLSNAFRVAMSGDLKWTNLSVGGGGTTGYSSK